MLGKAKMSVTFVFIRDEVKTVHDTSSIGHNFDFKAALSVSKRTGGVLSGEGIDSPDLQWKENIEWFERLPNGTWRYAGRVEKDMYEENPDSNTFRLWRDSRYYLASDDLNQPPPALKEAVQKDAPADADKAAKHWIAQNGFQWTVTAAIDRPALGLNPGASSGGGGAGSLVKSNTRRRVIYFDLGFTGNGPRASATQILEMSTASPQSYSFSTRGFPRLRPTTATGLQAGALS